MVFLQEVSVSDCNLCEVKTKYLYGYILDCFFVSPLCFPSYIIMQDSIVSSVTLRACRLILPFWIQGIMWCAKQHSSLDFFFLNVCLHQW